MIRELAPTSLIDAMARGDVPQSVVFAFLFRAACAAIGGRACPSSRRAANVPAFSRR